MKKAFANGNMMAAPNAQEMEADDIKPGHRWLRLGYHTALALAAAWFGGWLFVKGGFDVHLGQLCGALVVAQTVDLAPGVTEVLWGILVGFILPIYLGYHWAGTPGACVGILTVAIWLGHSLRKEPADDRESEVCEDSAPGEVTLV